MKKLVDYSKGHWYSLGFLIGITLGLAVGSLVGMISLGPILGVAFGVVFGYFFAEKFTPRDHKLTKEEKLRSLRVEIVSIGLAIIVILLTVSTIIINS